jgi:general L-amino acid transport system substrate-binding protein
VAGGDFFPFSGSAGFSGCPWALTSARTAASSAWYLAASSLKAFVSAGVFRLQLNLADVMASLGINYESIVFPDSPTTTAAYNEGTCDGFTTDKSGLISQKQELTNPEEHIILDVTMSKEPLGPAYSHGDNQWGDVVDWSVYCTISGEEYGITSENVDEMIETAEDPNIRRMLGVEGALGEGLGLGNDFCANIIREVGNYAEIYNRSLGPDTPYNVPRGLNNLYTEGGLLYAPPFR